MEKQQKSKKYIPLRDRILMIMKEKGVKSSALLKYLELSPAAYGNRFTYETIKIDFLNDISNFLKVPLVQLYGYENSADFIKNEGFSSVVSEDAVEYQKTPKSNQKPQSV